jgi:membrane-anchored mycosin MYCP
MFRRSFALFVLMFASVAFAEDKPAPTPTFAERQQPIFKLMQVEEGWKITRGGPGCVVGVIDSGFDYFHPALQANLKPGWFDPGVYHTDFFSMDAHGTLVASIIAARRVEGQDGMQGLAPDCTVLTAAQGIPLHKIFGFYKEYFSRKDATMDGYKKEQAAHEAEFKAWGDDWLEYVFGTVSEAIRYMADHNVRVINMSEFLTTSVLADKPELKARVDAAFAYAKQKDVLIVLGSGNSDNRITEYPGDADFVMIAGASTLADQRWSMKVDMYGSKIAQGSCYGPRLSVLAPVENIVAASPHEEAYYSWKDTPMGAQNESFEGSYTVLPWGATSSAAPQVAALAALVRSLRPDLTATAVIHLIEQGADPIGGSGFHEETGYGRINFLKTLELARKQPSAVTQP